MLNELAEQGESEEEEEQEREAGRKSQAWLNELIIDFFAFVWTAASLTHKKFA